MTTATAQAHPNIAFIKYWGNRDSSINLPAGGSISMNLDGLLTRTTVAFDDRYQQDALFINGKPAFGVALTRVARFLDHIRGLAGTAVHARIDSHNNFPSGAGIASSASAFAALALAGSQAAGLHLNERDLSRLARLGSGSASRSVPGGFVEWLPGQGDDDSYAVSIAPSDHWDLVDCIAVVSEGHKHTGSTEGHALAGTSLLQEARLSGVPDRLEACRNAILARDFEALAEVSELDSNLMHAVMMTSHPRLLYWQPATVDILQHVPAWRSSGLPVFFTVDAGPNVHVFSTAEASTEACSRLSSISGVKRVLTAPTGGKARLE